MKLRRPCFLVLALLWLTSLQAGTREAAFQARAMLDPGIWSRVLHLRNENAGRGSQYPVEFHGLVVAFEGILWLYTELDGTQSLSLRAGRLAQDQADLAPLLRAVEPGLAVIADVTEHPPAEMSTGVPPFACFLGSVARWRQLQAGPNPPVRARLLAYYPGGARQGHMVLEYWRDGRRYVFDPDRPGRDREVSPRLAEDPLKVSRAVFQGRNRDRPVRAMQLVLGGA